MGVHAACSDEWGASWKPLSIWLVAACSPPFWLALDRGNSDIFVFTVVVLAVALVIAELRVIPGVIVAIAGVLKIFTLGSGLMVVAMRRGRWWTTCTWVIGSLLAVAVLWQDLPLISARTPRSDWMSFGVSVVPIRFQEFLGPWEGNGRAIGLIAAAFFILGVWAVLLLERLAGVRVSRDALLAAFVEDRRAAAVLLAGSGTFLTAYLVGTGYDYRLMFLLLVVGAFLLVGRWTFGVAFAVLMWCSGRWTFFGDATDFVWLAVAPALSVLVARLTARLMRSNSMQKLYS